MNLHIEIKVKNKLIKTKALREKQNKTNIQTKRRRK